MIPITCNAVGDILTLASLLVDVVRALHDTRGSTAEYRAFIDEMDGMSKVLNIIREIVDESGDQELCNLAVKEVQRCCPDIQQGIDKTAKFSILAPSSSAHPPMIIYFQRQWYKIEWRFSKRSEVRALGGRLTACRQQLTLIMATLNSMKIDRCMAAVQNIREDSSDRFTSLSNAVTANGLIVHDNARRLSHTFSRFAVDQTASNLELKENLDRNIAVVHDLRNQLTQYFTSFARITPTAAGSVIGHNAQELGNVISLISAEQTSSQRVLFNLNRLAFQIFTGSLSRENATTISTAVIAFSALEVMNHFRMAFLYTTIFILLRMIWKLERSVPSAVAFSISNTVILIDAMGDRVTLPMQLCESPEIFHSTVLNLFLKRAGLEFIRRRAYEIEDVGTSLPLVSKTWSITIRPGMEIAMSVILHRGLQFGMKAACPWCGEKILCAHVDMRRSILCTSCFRPFHASIGAAAERQISNFLEDIDDRPYPRRASSAKDESHAKGSEDPSEDEMVSSDSDENSDRSQAASIQHFHRSLKDIRRIHVILAGEDFDGNNLKTLLSDLSEHLLQSFGHQVTLLVHGGVLMVLPADLSFHSHITGTTHDVDIMKKEFVKRYRRMGIEDAEKRLDSAIVHVAEKYGIRRDWMNGYSDDTLPVPTLNTSSQHIYEAIATASLEDPVDSARRTLFEAPGIRLVAITWPWTLALKFARYAKNDPADAQMIVRMLSLQYGLELVNAYLLEEYLRANCSAMGDEHWSEHRRREWWARLENAAAWEAIFESDEPIVSDEENVPNIEFDFVPDLEDEYTSAIEDESANGPGADMLTAYRSAGPGFSALIA